jgi:excisionase family DNA binding protein|tara:strand:+ start:307 stop:507 length:201 start_codon:yes stop_codon:yes gene_type:complete
MDEITAVKAVAFNVPEAASYLGISKSLAYELVRTGKLPAVRLGRRWLIPRASLDAMFTDADGGADS